MVAARATLTLVAALALAGCDGDESQAGGETGGAAAETTTDDTVTSGAPEAAGSILVEEGPPRVLVRAAEAPGDATPGGAVVGEVVDLDGCLALQLEGGDAPLPFLLPEGSGAQDGGAELPDGTRLTVGEQVDVGGMVYPADQLPGEPPPECAADAYAYVFAEQVTG